MKILGNWQPSSYDERTIASELRAFCAEHACEFTYSSDVNDVRSPADHRTVGVDAFRWHQDNWGEDTPTIVWSNVLPTEIRDVGTKESIPVRPGDVVWFDNQAVEHRAPENARDAERWFMRIRTRNKPE